MNYVEEKLSFAGKERSKEIQAGPATGFEAGDLCRGVEVCGDEDEHDVEDEDEHELRQTRKSLFQGRREEKEAGRSKPEYGGGFGGLGGGLRRCGGVEMRG